MHYVSTRGEAPSLRFADVLMAGLAHDGGLYVPQEWPQIGDADIAAFATRPYPDVAYAVIRPFVDGDIADEALKAMIEDAYRSFSHPAVTPLTQLDAGHFLLELFHGPTLAFKDVAMQLLARMMDHVLAERGRRATIVAATSGDTGGAAIEAFGGRKNVDVFVLFPRGRVSPVQQRQMTTTGHGNVHALAVEGTFDDCQALVKAMFNHFAFRERVGLSGVNSINWARIVAQVVYYFTAAASLGAPHRKTAFTVPTGNFGDVFAGYVAEKIGLPIDRLVIATNVNDILWRAMETGLYEVRGVTATASPSMDIQVSSNFERLLFEASGRDAAAIRSMMGGLAQAGRFTIPEPVRRAIAERFSAGRTDEAETQATIARVQAETGLTLDPHTAVAVHVAEASRDDGVPMVSLSTAHPAKFPDAVTKATGRHPALPAALSDLMDRNEVFTELANDLNVVERFIEGRTRARDAANESN